MSKWFCRFLLFGGMVLHLAAQTNVTITVDALANRHAINPNMYGTAFATTIQLSDLNSPLNRSGGNTTTTYNWQTNASNHASDYFFESISDGSSTPGASADSFVTTSKSGGAQPMLTIPIIGWVAKLGPNRGIQPSFSVAKYGAQQSTDPYLPDAGNGVKFNGQNVTGNDPNDAYVTNSPALQQGFVRHLISQFTTSTNGGVRYYLMDNEPSIWFQTHRDVHPVGSSMQEIRNDFTNYSATVKGVDAGALICGPEEWGWSGYFFSGYDQQWAGARGDYNSAHFPDRGTNGGQDFGPWFLSQNRASATATGRRLLDIFSLHFYPQGGEFGNNVSVAMQSLRDRSTRQLWDTNYTSESWINDKVGLIPRMKAWVATNYPGTLTGITEYNWGAEADMNGALAQADIFGIFGREGLDLAVRWTTPNTGTPTYLAMKLFRNYDGNKSTFGDVNVSATGPNPDFVSTYAATRTSDGALTFLVINKQLTTNATVTINLTNFFTAGAAQVWQLKATTPTNQTAASITHPGDISFAGNIFSNTVASNSVTFFVVPVLPPPTVRMPVVTPAHAFKFWLDGPTGQRYLISSSSNLVTWVPVWTNVLQGVSTNLVFTPPDACRFYRAQWAQ